jgi:four helix bundle protein
MKNQMNDSNDPLRDKTMLFAIRMVNLNRYLTKVKRELVVSNQITRSGTNPGAMVREAANAESGLDFVHKLGVAQKEIGETQYWLELLYKTHYRTTAQYNSLFSDSEEIMKMIRSSILTKKKNLAKKTLLLVLFLTTILLL